jgi:hypothetical protein
MELGRTDQWQGLKIIRMVILWVAEFLNFPLVFCCTLWLPSHLPKWGHFIGTCSELQMLETGLRTQAWKIDCQNSKASSTTSAALGKTG